MSKPERTRNRVHLAVRWIVGVLAVGFVIFGSSQTSAQELPDLIDEAEGFSERIGELESQYLNPALLAAKYKLENRFNEAQVAYTLEDYEQASLLFVSIIENSEPGEFASYRESLYLLADSLYQRRNFLGARGYFRQLVDLGPGDRYQDAIVRLLEIAAETGKYQSVDELYNEFDRGEELSAAVHYMRGKTLYEQGRYDEAIDFLERAERRDEFQYRARYFRGVCRVASEDFEGGREVFQGIVEDVEPEGERRRRIVHLSYLALGRIAYELGEVEKAIDAYQRLPRESQYFDRALYELTWVLVARENYAQASRNADIFLFLGDPDPTLIPEMELLKADLLLRRGRYDEATEAYETVIEDFKPIRKKMHQFLAGQSDLRAFFDSAVEREMAGEDTRYLPEKVRRWIDEGETMKRVKVAVRDVSKLRDDVEETEEALEELEARLGSGSRVKSFPTIAEGMRVGIETESQLLRLQGNLLQEEFDLLESEMNDQELAEWDKMQAKMEKFRERYEDIPKTRSAVASRDEKLQSEFERLRSELDEVAYLIDGQRDQLESVDEYIREEYGGTPPAEQRDKIEKLRDEVSDRLKRLKKREKQLRQRIATTRQKLGIGDDVTQAEQGMRKKYRRMLAERRQFLQQFHDRVSGQRREKLRRIERARGKLPDAHARLQGYFEKMRKLVEQKSQELRRTVQRERERLEDRKERLAQLRSDTKSTAGQVAYQNFRRVQNKFDEIVLRGDVGLIDVAWQKKEEETNKIEQLRADRSQALQELKESFKEVR